MEDQVLDTYSEDANQSNEDCLLPLFVEPLAFSMPLGAMERQEEDIVDGAAGVEDVSSDDDVNGAEQVPASAIVSSLQLYKEALASNDESGVAEIESFLKSIEEEKISLEGKVASLSEELLTEKERILRISADFDNFRKRTERDRLSLLTNAQGEVVESLLPVLDNFERAKSQIKVETEGEEKINNSYQSISKQFIEILNSLGVVPVETVGNPFDPLLHEAIMREDSNEYEEGIIIQEFRKGFKLGDRLLRPSMVKVSAGPGPVKPEEVETTEGHDTGETTEEGTAKSDST
ncbi:protein grpe [Quercus suber]|uniref:GrpE protein homolog n=1 Tax=Quercus suber TaxID=58331 RepID=A0AAW0LKQ4_QUESU